MNLILGIFNFLFFNNILKIKARKIIELPKYLKIGYTFYGECDDKIFEAVQNGLNIVIWSQIDFTSNEDNNKPFFNGTLDYSCVSKMNKKFRDNNYYVINLLSVGGYGCPHINTDFSADNYFKEWLKFNEQISSTENYFFGFDGIDWDIEGNDEIESIYNNFTYKELDIIGKFSQLLKKEGYIVSMTPRESYLDPSTNEFALCLINNNNSEGENILNDNSYNGRNIYSYIIAKYSINTFDFISIQLYEYYSLSLFKFQKQNKTFGEILDDLVGKLSNGYEVDFSKDINSGIREKNIKIPQNKIVIGLANAWASNLFLFLNEEYIIEGYEYLKDHKKNIRGFMFWNIHNEGDIPLSDNAIDKNPFYMSKIINSLFY